MYAFVAQCSESFLHEVHSSEGVEESGVHGARVDEVAESELSDTAESLDVGVLEDVVDEFIRNGEESEDRVVDYFAFVGHERRKSLQRYEKKMNKE